MNTQLLKKAAKLAMMTASTFDPNLEDTDALTELIIEFYEDIEAFAAQMLQFSKDEIENMNAATVEKLVSKYVD